MKTNQLKYITVSFAIIVSFFLGRESKELETPDKIQPSYFSDTLQKKEQNSLEDLFTPLQALSNNIIVYRCGKSKIYHPTKKHASFKRCKSKVYELTIERAKELGMRHCKCSS